MFNAKNIFNLNLCFWVSLEQDFEMGVCGQMHIILGVRLDRKHLRTTDIATYLFHKTDLEYIFRICLRLQCVKWLIAG